MKQKTLKFWLIFWTCSGIFLLGWYLFWNIRNSGIGETVSQIVEIFPISKTEKQKYQTLASLGEYFLFTHGQQRTLLVLLQNNLEIRPGGGFLSAFAIVKIKNGKILSMETYDLSNFDKQTPNNIKPPYPMKETGYIDSWKMRDSNFSPDFETNAKKAEEFYALGGGNEKFDGVVGITANMLTSILKITGPIQIEDYPGTYSSENAIISLEYQVEKAFEQQGIAKGDRKSVMNDLAREIEKKVLAFSIKENFQLLKILMQDLDKKDIQLYFSNAELQKKVRGVLWAGAVDQTWSKDYLMLIDANLGSFKSDYYVKRSFDYRVDLSKEIPEAHLKITYQHTAKQKDWMTRDYVDYLRIYVPKDSQFVDQKNLQYADSGAEFGKKYFDGMVVVPIDETTVVEVNYTLPKTIKDSYDLKIQKQAGLSDIPISVQIKNADGSIREFSQLLN